jgi:hypothetical protein
MAIKINTARRISTVCISGIRRKNVKPEENMAEVVMVVVVKFMSEWLCMEVENANVELRVVLSAS